MILKLTPLKSFIIASIAILFVSCKDDEEAAPVNQAPEIEIVSPTSAQLDAGFNRGEAITLVGTVSDDHLISTISIDVFYDNNDLGLDETLEVNNKTYSLEYTVEIPEIAPRGNYSIKITATDDEGLNTVENKGFRIN